MLKDCDGWLVKPVRLKSLHGRLVSREAPLSPSRNPTHAPEVARPLAGSRVLLAEDNDINALLVERHLSRLGAQVVRAHDGSEAVALVSSGGEKFDAVLMDVRMPGLDGLSAARQIRAAEQRAGTDRLRMVALTANASDEDRLAARRGRNGRIPDQAGRSGRACPRDSSAGAFGAGAARVLTADVIFPYRLCYRRPQSRLKAGAIGATGGESWRK